MKNATNNQNEIGTSVTPYEDDPFRISLETGLGQFSPEMIQQAVIEGTDEIVKGVEIE